MKYSAVILCMFLVGCSKTVWVSERATSSAEGRYRSVAGIPFYTKKEVLEQKTTFKKSWLQAKLTVNTQLIEYKTGDPVTSNLPSVVFVKAVSNESKASLDKIKKQILADNDKSGGDYNKLVSDFEAIENLANYDSVESSLISNSFVSKWVVDENSEYFLNAPLPWFGTGNLTQKINDNGTLQEATSTPDTKLAEGITQLIPLSDYLTAEYITESDEKTPDEVDTETTKLQSYQSGVNNGPSFDLSQLIRENKLPSPRRSKTIRSVSLNVDETGYLYECTHVHQNMPEDRSAIRFDDECLEFTRKTIEVAKVASTKKADEKQSGQKIDVSGSIIFPTKPANPEKPK